MWKNKDRVDYTELKEKLIVLIIGIFLLVLGINISDNAVVLGGVLLTIGTLLIIYSFFEILGWIHINFF